MKNDNQLRKQSEMNRVEWIRWCWIDVTEATSAERIYLRGVERPISEAKEAAEQFDIYHAAYQCTQQTPNDL